MEECAAFELNPTFDNLIAFLAASAGVRATKGIYVPTHLTKEGAEAVKDKFSMVTGFKWTVTEASPRKNYDGAKVFTLNLGKFTSPQLVERLRGLRVSASVDQKVLEAALARVKNGV